ncbi:HCP-like protein [Violaceomyces palustris]|uniref:HCP-like protein n=1 Tax=Violaceomyces palustris TaxID=1673888 RepID=A0ACD0NQ74_9BASI|nr:HCP-like protein [Violaceomyces palustris]
MTGPPPPQLPPLPPGFGNHSSYPPTNPNRAPSGSGLPTAPPLPPLPPGALEREQQLRNHRVSSNPTAMHAPIPHRMPSSVSGQSISPGQIIPSGSHQSLLSGGYGNSHSYLRSPSPAPPGAYHQPPMIQPGFNVSHLRPHSTFEAPTRPLSAATLPGAPILMPEATHHGHQPSRSHHMPHGESVPNIASGMSSMSINNSLGPPPSGGNHGAHAGIRRASSSEVVSSASDHHRAAQHHQGQASGPPSLNAPLPDVSSLESIREKAFASRDDRKQVSWAKMVLKFVERKFTDGSKISDPKLVQWTDEAIGIIVRRANSNNDPEALYLRGDLQASGAFPTYLKKDLKEAFNDFELSARMGWAPSWFRIGRDYELLNDLGRARDAYDRGVAAGDVGSIYRLGMANLLGQLDLSVNHAKAIAMLKDAADHADLDTPQPAYIYGMLLAGEFSHVDIPSRLLRPTPDPSNPHLSATLESEARRRIERAAYLNFAPAQYKCGWSYEYAQLDCPFDPLLSVQYYSLASQGGEIEADMALSKWFLCGAEGCFEKNEGLAFTFADKAARKGLASAEFALGYYYEVGVGTERNIETARKWYKKAAAHDNADAKERLNALEGPSPNSLSRTEHEAHVDVKLQRKRTQAKIKSDREGRGSFKASDPHSTGSAPGVPSDLSRRRTMRMVEEVADGGRRAGRRGAITEASESHLPPIAGGRQRQDRISSGTKPSAPGRHGSGYSLSDIYPAAPPPSTGSQFPQSQPQGIPHTPARQQMGMPSHLSNSPAAATATSHQQQHPAVPGSGTGSNNGTPNKKPGSSGSSTSVTGPPEKKVVYNTFAEMGFQPQKQQEKDCTIM